MFKIRYVSRDPKTGHDEVSGAYTVSSYRQALKLHDDIMKNHGISMVTFGVTHVDILEYKDDEWKTIERKFL